MRLPPKLASGEHRAFDRSFLVAGDVITLEA
jgi:hypothetical protein